MQQHKLQFIELIKLSALFLFRQERGHIPYANILTDAKIHRAVNALWNIYVVILWPVP